jgi:hypothetical protein
MQGEEGEPQQEAAPIPDAFMSIVAHRDTPALWITSGYDSRKAAEDAGLQGCERQMGKGCYVHWWAYNDFIFAVAEDSIGHIFVEGDINYENGRTKALTLCQNQSVGCKITQIISNSTGQKNIFPKTSPPIHKYAAVAWPKAASSPKWNRKYWLVSGIGGHKASVDAAIKRCAADTGLECVKGHDVASGVIARFIDEAGTTYWIDAANIEAAAKRVTAFCPQGKTCRIVELYPADEVRTSILDEDRADEPVRGFYSIAWPHAAAKGQKKIAIVTGQPSREAASRAAIALCQRENSAECKPVLEEEDWGTEQFVAISRDKSAQTRIEFGYSAAQAAEKMRSHCNPDHDTCPVNEIIDLSIPVSKTIGILTKL